MKLQDPFYISSGLCPALKLPNGAELTYITSSRVFTIENEKQLVIITGYKPNPLNSLQDCFQDILDFMVYAITTEDQESFSDTEFSMFSDCNYDDLAILAMEIEENEGLIIE